MALLNLKFIDLCVYLIFFLIWILYVFIFNTVFDK